MLAACTVPPTDFEPIKVGASRQAVEGNLGRPMQRTTIDDHAVDTYFYNAGWMGEPQKFFIRGGYHPSNEYPVDLFWNLAVLTVYGLISPIAFEIQNHRIDIVYGPDNTVLRLGFADPGPPCRAAPGPVSSPPPIATGSSAADLRSGTGSHPTRPSHSNGTRSPDCTTRDSLSGGGTSLPAMFSPSTSQRPKGWSRTGFNSGARWIQTRRLDRRLPASGGSLTGTPPLQRRPRIA